MSKKITDIILEQFGSNWSLSLIGAKSVVYGTEEAGHAHDSA